MNYETFVQEMLCCTKRQISSEECLEIHRVLKNNGVTLTGISIRKKQENVVPIIYLDEYYERYRLGENIESLSQELLLQRAEAPLPPEWDYRAILNFEEIREQVVFRLVNRQKNEKLLQSVPYLPVFDLAILFYVMVSDENAEECSILIRNSHMDLWKISIATLYETARKNTPLLQPYMFQPLSEYIQVLKCHDFFESPIWILTNIQGLYGASAVLYPKMPKRIYEKLGQSYFLLPSSIHEFLVVPESSVIYPDKLRDIVCEVNETHMEKEEVLGDSIYHFDGKNITKM